jgi:glycosyltransferase involved in cell wall biosynthesis
MTPTRRLDGSISDPGSAEFRAPRVSVVTPTYNRADLLPETIRSILAQTFSDFEYLIIDDGSTDDTAAVVRSFGDRIVYYRHENVGEAASTNRGWGLARGDYFAFVASDDPMLPNWLERMVSFLDRHPDILVAYPDWQIIDAESRLIGDATTFGYSFDRMVAWLYTLPGPGALIRKRALADLRLLRDPSYRFMPDLECFLRLGLRGPFAYVPETLATWRQHATSTTVADRSVRRAREFVRVADAFFARRDLPAEIRSLRPFARSRAYWLAAWVVLETSPLRSALYLRRSYAISLADPPGLPLVLRRYPRPDRPALRRAGLAEIERRLPGVARLARFRGRRGRTARSQGVRRRRVARLLGPVARAAFLCLAGLQVAAIGPVLLLALYAARGFFDDGFYRDASLPGSLSRRFPRLSFAFRGAWTLRDPNPWFSQRAYLQQRSGMTFFPPVLQFLLRDRYLAPPAAAPLPAGESPSPEPAAQARPDSVPQLDPASSDVASRAEPLAESEAAPASQPPLPPPDRFTELWPSIRADLLDLQDVANQLSPTAGMHARLTHSRAVPTVRPAPGMLRALLQQMPARVDHLLVVPWLGIPGGAERVGQRLIRLLREHYGAERVCVLAPDSIFDLTPDQRSAYGVPIVAVNDVARDLDDEARLEVLDRVLIELRPRTVHSNNSMLAWKAFREHGRHYARDSNLFGSIYSNLRILDQIPIGFYWQFLPEVIDCLTGAIADNGAVIRRAAADFGFIPDQMARLHLLPTPVLGLGDRPAEADLRPYQDSRRRHSLWMSRISPEKRLDVLQAVAIRCPDRQFSIYGTIIEPGLPVDLSWVAATGNVRVHGAFGQLADLPLEQFDSYVFTSSAEGMPIALLEAVMLGLPVVAPDVGGIGELIDGTTGWLVSGPDAVDEYVAALDEIHRRPAEAARRVAAAQARLLERHSWDSFRRCARAIPGYLQPGG